MTALRPMNLRPMKERSVRRWGVITVAVLALLLGGCIRVDVNMKVQSNGSGVLSTLLALSDDALKQTSDTGKPEDAFSGVTANKLPKGAHVEAYKQDGFTGVRTVVPFPASNNPGNEIRKATDANAAALGAPPGDPISQ